MPDPFGRQQYLIREMLFIIALIQRIEGKICLITNTKLKFLVYCNPCILVEYKE